MTDERKAKILTKKGYYYRELIEEIDDTFIPQETLRIIKELKNMGLKLGVASSSFNARYLLNKLGLLNHFDVVVDGTLVTNVKPDPELFIKCASLMSLREKDLVVVEDAPSGIDAGNEGGFITIGIGYATKYNKTNVKINSILELKDVINKLNSLVK
jgi:beta-phosphoglucomutase